MKFYFLYYPFEESESNKYIQQKWGYLYHSIKNTHNEPHQSTGNTVNFLEEIK